MSFYIGTIRITYDELIEKLGNPNEEFGDDKTHAEWIIKHPTKNYDIYIYDYKTEKLPYEEYNWHIGGYDDEGDLEVIQNIFKDKVIKNEFNQIFKKTT